MRRCLVRVWHVKMLQSDWLLTNHWMQLVISRNHVVFQYLVVKIKNFHAAKINGKDRKYTTHSRTHSHSHTLTLTLTHAPTHTHTRSHSHSHTLTLTLTHAPTHTHTRSHTHTRARHTFPFSISNLFVLSG